jgi:hypothetical protein
MSFDDVMHFSIVEGEIDLETYERSITLSNMLESVLDKTAEGDVVIY